MSSNPLTWALTIATYKREHILLRCLRLAANQTKPPQEIVVVDASPNFEEIQSKVIQEISQSHPHIKLIYVKAERPSSTAQRNQAIQLASADILFLIDDDSLMYLDCAEEVMKVYEADSQEIVKGVSPIPVPTPPDFEEDTEQSKAQTPSLETQFNPSPIRRLAKSLLKTEQTYFLPYDEDYPVHEIPQEISHLNIGQIEVMAGYAMTFRRSILQKELFSEILDRYAAGEDQDLSYRVSRHGLILNAIDARLCHLQISGGRLSKYVVAILSALNPAVLHQFYSSDLPRSHQKWRAILKQRLLMNFLKDLTDKYWDLPRARGIMYALSKLELIYSKSPQDLLEFYPKFQAELIEQDRQG